MAFHHTTGGCHEQGKSKIGGGIGEHAGGVANRDTAACGFADINIVKANSAVADHLEPWARSIHDRRIDLIGQ